MLTVKELLKQCDEAKLVKELENEFRFDEHQYEFVQQSLKNRFDLTHPIAPCFDARPNTEEAIIVPYMRVCSIEKYSYITDLEPVITFKKDYLTSKKANLIDVPLEEIIDGTGLDKLNEVIEGFNIEEEEFYGRSQYNVLSYYVPDCMIKKYGLEKIIANILYELTGVAYAYFYKCESNLDNSNEFNQSNETDFTTVQKYERRWLELYYSDSNINNAMNLKNTISIILNCNEVIDEINNESGQSDNTNNGKNSIMDRYGKNSLN